MVGREATLKVPMDILGGLGSDYKFGVQTNGGGSPFTQTFYPNKWNLWTIEGGSDYTTSANYKDMTLGTVLTSPFTVLAGDRLDFVIMNYFPQMMKPATYTITTTVK